MAPGPAGPRLPPPVGDVTRSLPLNRPRRPASARAPRRRFRRPLLEALGDRTLLSGPHDAALVDAIRSSLLTTNTQGLSTWSDRLTDPAILGRAIPLLGSQLRTQYSPRA